MEDMGIGTIRSKVEVDARTGDAALQETAKNFAKVGSAAEDASKKITDSANKSTREQTLQRAAIARQMASLERWSQSLDKNAAAQKRLEAAQRLVMSIQAQGAAESGRLTRAMELQATAAQNLAQVTSKGGFSVKELLSGGLALAGVSVGATAFVAGAREMISSSMELGVEIGHLAQQTGISAQNLSVLKYAAGVTGVEFDTLTKGFKKLSTEVYTADNGSKSAQKSFTALGISAADLRAKGNDLYGVFGLVADRFKAMPDGIEKNALATQLFGKAGQALIPILNQGSGAVVEFSAQARSMGLVLDDDGVKKMEDLHKSVLQMKGAFAGLGLEISSDFAAPLEKSANTITHWIQQWKAAPGLMLKGTVGEMLGFFDPDKAFAGADARIKANWSSPPAGNMQNKTPSDTGDDSDSGGKPPRGSSGREAAAPAWTTVPFSQTVAEFRQTISPWRNAIKAVMDAARADAASGRKADAEAFAIKGEAEWREFLQKNTTQINSFDFDSMRGMHIRQSASVWQLMVMEMDRIREGAAKLADTLNDVGPRIKSISVQMGDGLNSEMAKAITGQRANFSGVFQSGAEGLAKTGLEKMEGSILNGFGLGGAKTKKPSGAAGDEIHTIVANLPGSAAAAGGSGGAVSRGLIGWANDNNWLGSHFGWLFGSGGLLDRSNAGGGSGAGIGAALSDVGGTVLKGLLPGFASGGPIPSNLPAIVGEEGPELFVPQSAGRIVPNDQLSGIGAGAYYNITVNGGDPELNRINFQQALARVHGSAVQSAIAVQREQAARVPRSKAR